MKNTKFPLFTGMYFLLTAMVIAAEFLNLKWAFLLSKPLPLLFIFVFYLLNSQHQKGKAFRVLMLTAFLFCAAGDTLLMFTSISEGYFIAGLVAFLIGHVLYTSAFTTEIFAARPWNQHWGQLAFSTLLVVYGAEFYILNRFSFGALWLPVLVYCVAITAMGVAATMRNFSTSGNAFFKVIAGAVFFVISDSLLATNKFVVEFAFSGPLILGTYFLGQYLIATGCVVSGMEQPKTENFQE